MTTLKAKVDRAKPATEKTSEVIIYVDEMGKGRVPALTLFKFLTQPDKFQQLRQGLSCEKLFPLVELSKADREKFLNTPPDGFDANLWRQVSIYGFQRLSRFTLGRPIESRAGTFPAPRSLWLRTTRGTAEDAKDNDCRPIHRPQSARGTVEEDRK